MRSMDPGDRLTGEREATRSWVCEESDMVCVRGLGEWMAASWLGHVMAVKGYICTIADMIIFEVALEILLK